VLNAKEMTINENIIRASETKRGSIVKIESTNHAQTSPANKTKKPITESRAKIDDTICVTLLSSPFAYASTTYLASPAVKTLINKGRKTIKDASTG
jgi:hypothetical protein